jgi:hypothetical protein
MLAALAVHSASRQVGFVSAAQEFIQRESQPHLTARRTKVRHIAVSAQAGSNNQYYAPGADT